MKPPNPASPRKKKVLIVDDHPLLRQGLRSLIDQQSDLVVCGEAGNVRQALVAVEKFQPNVVLVDLSLPDGDGLALTKDLRAQHPKVLVLVLSQHDETLYAERALRAGARGYIMKSEPTEIYLSAIRRVLAGETAISRAIFTKLTKKLITHASPSPIEQLSDRELEIFRLFGAGRNGREIAADLHLSIKTIDAHRTRIYRKLSLRGAADMLFHATRYVQNETRSPAS